MAKYAQIEAFFWNDPDVRRLTPYQRYLYLWTFTNMRCGISGLYSLDLTDAIHETGMNRRAFNGAWEGLHAGDKIEYDAPVNVLWVRGKFNQAVKPSRRDQTKGPSVLTIRGAHNELQELQPTHLISGFWLKYSQFFEGYTCPFDGAYKGHSPVTVSVDVSVSETVSVKEPCPPTAGDGFDQFWGLYPKKVGKAKAVKVWNRLKLNPLTGRICSAVASQKRTDQWQKEKGQFIPHPTTWLNEGRWDDEVAPPADCQFPTDNSDKLDLTPEEIARNKAARYSRYVADGLAPEQAQAKCDEEFGI
jgi:hypothetical protein